MEEKVTNLTQRVAKLEREGVPNSSGNADSKYLKALDDEDPARKQVAFVGWPDNVEVHAGLNQL